MIKKDLLRNLLYPKIFEYRTDVGMQAGILQRLLKAADLENLMKEDLEFITKSSLVMVIALIKNTCASNLKWKTGTYPIRLISKVSSPILRKEYRDDQALRKIRRRIRRDEYGR